MGKTIDRHFGAGYQQALRDVAAKIFLSEEEAADWVINNLEDRKLSEELRRYYYYGE